MKVLVIGASGQVGRRLMERLKGHEVVGTGHRNAAGLTSLDLADAVAVRKLIQDQKPQTIIVPGGVTAVDWCEDNAEEARRVMVDGTRAVQQAADEIDAHVIHFSTDYVFAGGKGPYREEARPDPISAYGRIKLEGELAVRESTGTWSIVRTSMVYSRDPGGKNFAQYVIDTLSGGGAVSAFSDQTGSPTYAPALAKSVIELMERKLTGVWHVSGPQVLTRLDFARQVARAFGLIEEKIKPVKGNELNLKAKRPGMNAGLAAEKARKMLRSPLVALDDALREMRTADPT